MRVWRGSSLTAWLCSCGLNSFISDDSKRRVPHQVLGVDSLSGGKLAPGSLAGQLPGKGVVAQLELQELLDLPVEVGVGHGHYRLDPPVEVTRHQVGRPDESAAAGSSTKAKDPRVLEIVADERTDVDSFRQAGHARFQAADSAHDQIDPGTVL